jgi:hypothetical protein
MRKEPIRSKSWSTRLRERHRLTYPSRRAYSLALTHLEGTLHEAFPLTQTHGGSSTHQRVHPEISLRSPGREELSHAWILNLPHERSYIRDGSGHRCPSLGRQLVESLTSEPLGLPDRLPSNMLSRSGFTSGSSLSTPRLPRLPLDEPRHLPEPHRDSQFLQDKLLYGLHRFRTFSVIGSLPGHSTRIIAVLAVSSKEEVLHSGRY